MKEETKTINVKNLKKITNRKSMIEILNKVKNLINFSIIKELQYLEGHYKNHKVQEYLIQEKCKKMMLQMHFKNNNLHH